MKIYKVRYFDQKDRSNLQLFTAESKEDVVRIIDDDLEIQKTVDCGPYINEGAYKELRKEILDK